jgi:hypothetical protein
MKNKLPCKCLVVAGFGFMMFNATFNNLSGISWGSVLFVEELEYPEKTTDLTDATYKL